MLALRWHGRRDVRLEEVARPADPGPGMVDVAVSLCGICGTDLAEYRGGPMMIRPDPHPLTGAAPPVTLGHEFAGRVIAVGDGVGLELGTRVTADACWRCGSCPGCLEGEYQRCRYSGSIGLHSDGAMAGVVRVPDYTVVPLPEAVSDLQAALTEPLAVALHGLERAGVGAADSVLVLGFGPIGAAASLVGAALGAEMIVVDASSARAAAAESLGFETIAAGKDLRRRVRGRLGRLGADVVLECTGVPDLLAEAIGCAERGGRIVALGIGTSPAPVTAASLTLYERSLIGSLGYRNDLPRIVRLMATGRLDPTPLVGGIVDLEDAPQTFADLADAPDARIKVLLRPPQ